MAGNKDLNRLKVVLVEKKKSSLWLSRQLGCAPTTVSMMKTAKLLDVDLNDLVRFEELDKN